MSAVSIIVPVYNAERTLRRCVESLLAQSFPDFELILVDDGSTDGSGVICEEYAARDGRVRSLRREHGGVSAVRNAGMDAAAGAYLMFCDSDDTAEPDWCGALWREAVRRPDALVACGVRKAGDGERMAAEGDAATLSYFELYKRGLSAYTCNKIYAAEKVRRLGLRFEETLDFAEDVEFNVRYCAACESVALIERELYRYEQTEESASGRYRAELFSLHLRPFACRLPLIGERDIPEYCDIWFYHFYHLFENVFDPRNSGMGFWEKMRYNQKMLRSEEVRFCLEHASLEKENPLLMRLMKSGSYYPLWLAQRLAGMKKTLVVRKCASLL